MTVYDYGEGLSEIFFAGIFGDREMVHKSEYCVSLNFDVTLLLRLDMGFLE